MNGTTIKITCLQFDIKNDCLPAIESEIGIFKADKSDSVSIIVGDKENLIDKQLLIKILEFLTT